MKKKLKCLNEKYWCSSFRLTFKWQSITYRRRHHCGGSQCLSLLYESTDKRWHKYSKTLSQWSVLWIPKECNRVTKERIKKIKKRFESYSELSEVRMYTVHKEDYNILSMYKTFQHTHTHTHTWSRVLTSGDNPPWTHKTCSSIICYTHVYEERVTI